MNGGLKKWGKWNIWPNHGILDGAEISELVGLYLLHLLTNSKNKAFEIQNIGLYRDDGLALARETGRTLEKFMQKVRDIFKAEGLNIEIEAGSNLKVTDFLDLTLDLNKNGTQTLHETKQQAKVY